MPENDLLGYMSELGKLEPKNDFPTVEIFSWGYWGWGPATVELVSLADAVERSRGFDQPLFIDIRKHRNVRAKGFQGEAFSDLLGAHRYLWIQGLGNAIPEGPGVRIIDEGQSATLIEEARRAGRANRRVIFFCSCEHPGIEGDENACHRVTVRRLVAQDASRRGLTVAIEEWPGHRKAPPDVEVDPSLFRKIKNGRMAIPLKGTELPVRFSVGWGSEATIRCGAESLCVSVGPVRLLGGQWSIPIVTNLAAKARFAGNNQSVEAWLTERGY